MHFLGLRHKRERKEGSHRSKSTPYTIFLDKVTFVVGIIGPFTVLPQIYTIFSTQNAHGVSLMTWLLMFVVMLPWIFYGIAHRDKTIISSFILWEVVNATVVAGVLLYS